jgi:hypothetical protein
VREYLLLWADCYDYDTGFQDSHHLLPAGSFALEMVASTEREITSCISDLCQQHPNAKAMHSARDATEKALKAYLAHHAQLTPESAKKKFSHRLDKLMQEITRRTPQSPIAAVANNLNVFAPYAARYTGTKYSRQELWQAYRLAQFAAAEVVRSITGRNERAVIQSHPPFNGA